LLISNITLLTLNLLASSCVECHSKLIQTVTGNHELKVMSKIKRLTKAIYISVLSIRSFRRFDRNWFKGKRVAIVGGADSVLCQKLGSYIDSFDVVVRVNNGVRIISSQHEYVGTRTDFLVHAFYARSNDIGSSEIETTLWDKHGVKQVIFAFNFYQSRDAAIKALQFLRHTKFSYKYTMPPVGIADKCSMLVYPAWRNLHGVTPITPTHDGGYRNSLIFYPLKAFFNE